AFAVASPSWVYLRHQILKWSALALAAIGMVLITASVWRTVEVDASASGLKLKIDQMQAALEAAQRTQVELGNQLAAARQEQTQWVSIVKSSIADNQNQIAAATQQQNQWVNTLKKTIADNEKGWTAYMSDSVKTEIQKAIDAKLKAQKLLLVPAPPPQ